LTDCSCWDGVMKVGGCCYYHCKKVANLLRSSDGLDGHRGSLSVEQERFIGIQDPDTSGQWDYSATPAVPAPDLLTWLLEREAVQPWERMSEPTYDNSSRRHT